MLLLLRRKHLRSCGKAKVLAVEGEVVASGCRLRGGEEVLRGRRRRRREQAKEARHGCGGSGGRAERAGGQVQGGGRAFGAENRIAFNYVKYVQSILREPDKREFRIEKGTRPWRQALYMWYITYFA